MNQYSKIEWAEFRKNLIELDGNKCAACGKSGDEVTLQVHHKKYIRGRKPWQYANSDCITLCQGCHAGEHGIIMPKVGWEYLGDDDLGDLIGICENCGNSIRYAFQISHEKWETIVVGTQCCDNLTDSNIASNQIESVRRYEARKKTFLESKRWAVIDDKYCIRQSLFDVEITNSEKGFLLKIHTLKSDKNYLGLEEAKSKAFDVIESGELIDYLEKHNIEYGLSKTKKIKQIEASAQI